MGGMSYSYELKMQKRAEDIFRILCRQYPTIKINYKGKEMTGEEYCEMMDSRSMNQNETVDCD